MYSPVRYLMRRVKIPEEGSLGQYSQYDHAYDYTNEKFSKPPSKRISLRVRSSSYKLRTPLAEAARSARTDAEW